MSYFKFYSASLLVIIYKILNICCGIVFMMKLERSSARALNFLLAILVGAAYIFLFSQLPDEFFRDRLAYEVFIEVSGEYLSGLSLFNFIFNEPVFLCLNSFLLNFFNASTILNLYLIYILFVTIFFLHKYSYNFFMFLMGLIVILSSVLLLHIELVVLRQSIATLTLLIMLNILKNNVKNVLLSVFFVSLIHSSFFIFLFFYTVYFIFLKNYSLFKSSAYLSLLALTLGSSAVFFAQALGMRQGKYLTNELSYSGAMFIVSLLIYVYIYYVNFDEKFKNLYLFVIIGFAMYLGFYFVSVVSSRLISTVLLGLVFLLVTKFNYKNILFMLFLISVFFYDTYILKKLENSSLYVTQDEIFIYILNWLF